MIKAIIFDVDGTLAETEEAHRAAFNTVFHEFDLDWTWDTETYRRLLSITGGKERIIGYMQKQEFSALHAEQVKAMHVRKNALFADHVKNGLVVPRPGVCEFVEQARTMGLKIAIATTTSYENFNALLEYVFPQWSMNMFSSVVCGENVKFKKPDPEVYLTCLKELSVASDEAVAVEDSEVGLRSAISAGLMTIVTPSSYTSHQSFESANIILADLNTNLPKLLI